MNNEKGKKVWLIVMIVSCLFFVWIVFTLAHGDSVLENGLHQYAGSSLEVASLDEEAQGFLNMAMIKPLWEEIWIGILGIVIALGLKQKRQFAWIMGILWSAMVLVNGMVQGGYEMFILGWSAPCPQTYVFLVCGIIPLISLLVVRKRFLVNEAQAS